MKKEKDWVSIIIHCILIFMCALMFIINLVEKDYIYSILYIICIVIWLYITIDEIREDDK